MQKTIVCLVVLYSHAHAQEWSRVTLFDLEQSVYLYTARHDGEAEARVDLGMSSLLSDRNALRPASLTTADVKTRPKIMKRALKDKDKGSILFDAGVWHGPNSYGAWSFRELYPCGLKYEVRSTSRSVSVELRPVFTLPSGKIVKWTAALGDRYRDGLLKTRASANQANAALPGMRSRLGQLQSVANSRSGQYKAAGYQAGRLQGQIAAAESLVASLPSLHTEIATANAFADYSRTIAGKCRLYVSIYINDELVTLEPGRRGVASNLKAVNSVAKPSQGPARTWKSAKGNHAVEAKYIKTVGDIAWLQRARDKKVIKVPMANLSPEDVLWIETKASGDEPNPFLLPGDG